MGDLHYLSWAKQIFDQGLYTWDEINKMVNEEYPMVDCPTGEALRKRVFRATRKGNMTYNDKKPAIQPETVDEYWEMLKEQSRILEQLDTRQNRCSIHINDDKPIGLVFSGDWHGGERGIASESLEKDLGLIEQGIGKGLYWIGMGDYKGNYQPSMGRVSRGMYDAVAKPSMQELVVVKLAKPVARNCMALIKGCHESFDDRADKDFTGYLAELLDAVNLWHGGVIELGVGKQQYKVMARHKFGGNALNSTNAQRQLDDKQGPFDVISLAHFHYGDCAPDTRKPHQPWYLRSGTYKMFDPYGETFGSYTPQRCTPMVIFYPDEKKKVGFLDFEEGLEALATKRANLSAI